MEYSENEGVMENNKRPTGRVFYLRSGDMKQQTMYLTINKNKYIVRGSLKGSIFTFWGVKS